VLSSLPAPWPAVASAFLTEAQLRGGSLRTPVEYARILSRFFARYPNPTQVTPIGIHTFAYGRSPGRAGPAASTICVRLAAISGFYAFAQRLGAIDRNPAADIRRPRPSAPLPRGLEPDQLQRLLAAVPPTASGRRDRAIILLVLLEGLRRSEVLGLRAADIDLGTGDYQIQVKGGHRRRRRLPPPVLEAIAASLAARGTSIDRLGPNALVFPISGSGFYANLRRYAAAASCGGQAAASGRGIHRGGLLLPRPRQHRDHGGLPAPTRDRARRGLARSGDVARSAGARPPVGHRQRGAQCVTNPLGAARAPPARCT